MWYRLISGGCLQYSESLFASHEADYYALYHTHNALQLRPFTNSDFSVNVRLPCRNEKERLVGHREGNFSLFAGRFDVLRAGAVDFDIVRAVDCGPRCRIVNGRMRISAILS